MRLSSGLLSPLVFSLMCLENYSSHFSPVRIILDLWILFLSLYVFFFLLRLHLRQMEVPRWGVKSELPLLAYATATAIPDPTLICDLCCSLSNIGSSLIHWARPGIKPTSSWRLRQVLNPLRHSGNSSMNGFWVKDIKIFLTREVEN